MEWRIQMATRACFGGFPFKISENLLTKKLMIVFKRHVQAEVA